LLFVKYSCLTGYVCVSGRCADVSTITHIHSDCCLLCFFRVYCCFY